ncbi:CotO family spore coat protein [Bacillus sp. CLL-7-23]|uniref:CotO family spore coat protein n=1 Tax=Bacillus changyiensis TaxID=3004103 RepID=A0ABT4X206_9BACI|nr:CotO family spore coat protein [Bacillus changyiensis]MDA7026127.1 CotO family spore coat protein [Bacillus changyiensis]
MSDKKNNTEQKPLMYIVQPDYETIEANMQDILIKKRKTAKPNIAEKKPKKLKEEQPTTQNSKEDAKQEPVPNKEPERHGKGLKPVKKPLNKMTISEKIDFLTSFPGNMPKTLCLIEAGGKTYRGTLVEKKGDAVFVRTSSKGAPAELQIDSITALHPLGF